MPVKDASTGCVASPAKPDVQPGYKRTKVGVIPRDWDIKQLKDIADFTNGKPHERDVIPIGRYQLITLDSVGIDGKLKADHKQTDVFDNSLQRNDIVTVLSDIAHGNLLGLCDLIPSDGAYVLNQRVGRLRIKTTAYPGFVRLQINRQQDHFRKRGQGTSQLHVYRRDFDCLWIPFPPEPEQRAIADALSDVDGLLGTLETLIAKKRGLKQAAMQHLLTGGTRLPEFHGEWEVKRICKIATPSSEKNTDGKNLPVLACSKHFGFVDSLGFFKNQVFSKDLRAYKVIRRGQLGYPANHVEEGSIGLQVLYDVALVSPIYVVFTTCKDVNSFFLHRILKLDAYRQKFKSATTSSVDRRGSLRWPAFSQISVSLPALPEQDAIAAVLSDIDSELAALEQRWEKTHALKQSMLQQLLTGKTRLI